MSEQDQAAALAAEKAAREKAEAEAAEAKADLKKLKDEKAKNLRDASHQQNADFAEGLVKEGRLKPADKALVVQGHYALRLNLLSAKLKLRMFGLVIQPGLTTTQFLMP